ncbi:MAG: hypothetical protein WA821_20895 [Anaerolineales bacterium]
MTTELWAFVLQIGVFLSYIPITFIAYRILREPAKRKHAQWELSLFGIDQPKDLKGMLAGSNYGLGQYVVPLVYIVIVLAALYGITHPTIIRLGLWDGLLENTVNVFMPAGTPPLEIAILTGRFMFWCWLGAYIQSVDRTIRHYLAHDISPNVYISGTRRFLVAFIVGSIVGLGVGSLGKAANIPFDQNLTMVYVVSFAIGLFPDQGTRWIVTTANKILRQKLPSEQKPLTLIEGIGDWQQGRLDQEGISNVQNLAMINLLSLVTNTPFDASQIVDWVDQAILITEASPEQLAALGKVSLHCASNVLRATDHSLEILSKASGLSEDELQLLSLALRSSTNIELIFRFHKNANNTLK